MTDRVSPLEPLLEVSDLRVHFDGPDGTARAVDGVSFGIARGETLALVGESGCGKSVTALSLLRLIDPPGHIEPGSRIRFNGRELLTLPEREMRALRGNRIAMVFQEPASALNPVFTVGDQVAEVARIHDHAARADAWAQAVAMLRRTGIPDAAERARDYPHQLSGGMRQRVLIAMALACEPELLIADEPTTALDVTIQAQILDLLKDVRDKLGLAVLLISHDLGVIADFCERVIVMYGGKVLERAPAAALFGAPANPYTLGLLRAMPRFDSVSERLVAIDGSPPDLREPPPGCPFQPRCDWATAECAEEMPSPTAIGPEHQVSCWHAQPSDSKVLAHG